MGRIRIRRRGADVRFGVGGTARRRGGRRVTMNRLVLAWKLSGKWTYEARRAIVYGVTRAPEGSAKSQIGGIYTLEGFEAVTMRCRTD